MFWFDLFFTAAIAFVLGWLLVGVIGWRAAHRPDAEAGPTLLFVVVLIALVAWPAGTWSTPFGPPLRGFYWAPFLAAGLLVALVIGALGAPRRPPRDAKEARRAALAEAEAEQAMVTFFGIFFWILLLVAGATLLMRYLR